MDYERIYQWTAQRSGASLTVQGRTAEGNPRKLTKIKSLCAANTSDLGNHTLAIAEDGARYRLLP